MSALYLGISPAAKLALTNTRKLFAQTQQELLEVGGERERECTGKMLQCFVCEGSDLATTEQRDERELVVTRVHVAGEEQKTRGFWQESGGVMDWKYHWRRPGAEHVPPCRAPIIEG